MSQSLRLETRSGVSSAGTSARSTRLGALAMNSRQRVRRIRSKRRGSGRCRVSRSLSKRSIVHSHDIRNVALQVGPRLPCIRTGSEAKPTNAIIAGVQGGTGSVMSAAPTRSGIAMLHEVIHDSALCSSVIRQRRRTVMLKAVRRGSLAVVTLTATRHGSLAMTLGKALGCQRGRRGPTRRRRRVLRRVRIGPEQTPPRAAVTNELPPAPAAPGNLGRLGLLTSEVDEEKDRALDAEREAERLRGELAHQEQRLLRLEQSHDAYKRQFVAMRKAVGWDPEQPSPKRA
jgi:hypothetical protein